MPVKNHIILCIDDDPDDLELLIEACHKIDPSHKIEVATNGYKGLDKLQEMKKNDDLPCLVVLDINMPGLNGKETLTEIKKDSDLSKVHIVIFSTSNSSVDKLFFQSKGVEYMTKPLDYASLIKVASKLLSYCSR